MKICFVSLSRKRTRYFTQLAKAAPPGVETKVFPGVGFDFDLLCSLFSFYPDLDFGLAIHQRRQRLNYPRIFSVNIALQLTGALLVYLESVRFGYYLRIFRRERVTVLAIWNGQKLPYTTVVLAARHAGARVVFFENGGLPDTTTVDCRGVNAKNSLSRDPNFYREYYSADSPISPESPVLEPENNRYILVPLQVESDTQMVLHSPWISSSDQLVREVVAAARPYIGVGDRVLLKPHPKARTVVALPKGEGVDLVDGKVSDLLQRAAVVVTVNSTVGLEAVAAGRSVIVLGDAFYGIPGVACRARSSEELRQCLAAVLSGEWQPDPDLANSFLRYLRDIYYIPQDWRLDDKLAAKHFEAVWQRVLRRDELANTSLQINVEGGTEI